MTAESPHFDPAYAAVTKALSVEVLEDVEGLLAAFGVACEREAPGSLAWLDGALRASGSDFYQAVLSLYLRLLALLAAEEQGLGGPEPAAEVDPLAPYLSREVHEPSSIDIAALLRALGRRIAIAQRLGDPGERHAAVDCGDRILASLVVGEARRILSPAAGPDGQAALERVYAHAYGVALSALEEAAQ